MKIFGHFEFMLMSMGLLNTPWTFQSVMNEVFYDYLNVFFVYCTDDLLSFSKEEEPHLKHIEIVLSGMEEHKLFVGKTKSQFMQNEVHFLCLNFSQEAITIGRDIIKAVQDWPFPKPLSKIWSFIGLLQFFIFVIKGFSELARPLTDLTRKDSVIHNWNSNSNKSFKILKSCLTSAPILASLD